MIIEINNILDVEKCLNGVHAVIFDLDDTLYSEKEYVRSGYCAVGRHFRNISEMERKLWNAFEERKQPFNEVLMAEGMLSDENLKKCLQIYREHVPEIHLYPGVREMLCRLRCSGRKLGLITDGRPDGQNAKINSLNIETLFDEIIVTDELGGAEFRKPNDKAFFVMQEKLDCPFYKMVYVGDNPKKDFIAPHQLGMGSIWFQNREGLYYANC